MPEVENLREDDGLPAVDVDRIAQDFARNTLGHLEGLFSQLIQVASLRDYNTGRYHHYGLETRYTPEAVHAALRQCHEQVFAPLTRLPLEEQTQDLLRFFESLKSEGSRLVEVWQRLKAYELLPPENCHPLARQLFNQNVEIVLSLLKDSSLRELLREAHSDPHDLP